MEEPKNTIKLKIDEIYTREVNHNNTTFLSHSVKIDDEFYNVKFTKECKNPIKETGYHSIIVEIYNITLNKEKKVIWVFEVEKIKRLERNEIKQSDEKVEFFSKFKVEDDTLPF